MRTIRRVALLLLVEAGAALASPPPLGPDDLALVYNTFVPASRELAEYYASRRGVRADRLIGLPCSTDETIAREHYEAFARSLRRALHDAGLEDHVRCLVTFYGLPLRVAPFRPTAAQQELARALDRDLITAAGQLQVCCAQLESLAGGPATAPAATRPTEADGYEPKELLERYRRAAAGVVRRIQTETDPDRRADLVRQLFTLVEKVEGSSGLFNHLSALPEAARPAAVSSMNVLRDELKQKEERINRLLRSPIDSRERADARGLIAGFQGLLGLMHALRNDRNRLEGSDTEAAFDSELALLWWDDYSLYRWIVNLLAWRARADAGLRQAVPPHEWLRRSLMVARLDGPTPEIVRRMIDDALFAEREGLRGTFYVDARGLSRDATYGAYDTNLRDLADRVASRSAFPLVLDNRPELFAPGACPDAALYCGWYSVEKYVPAFTFARGAVGYHIASAEAVTLRRPDYQGWCKRMLDDGVAATLGPVGEPYLHAFPLPKDFFGLLLTGRFTLAECFAYTSPFHSWMMTLLGDPLYRPFAGRPALDLADAFPRDLTPVEYGGTASPPATPPATAPAP